MANSDLIERNQNQYPSPYLNIASTFLPTTVRDLFRWLEFYYVSFPEAYRVLHDLATFPLTDISIDDEDDDLAQTYRLILTEEQDLKAFLGKIGLDYMTFGNAYATILYPFSKYGKCKVCLWEQVIETWSIRVRGKKIEGECPKCEKWTRLEMRDQKVKDRKRIKLVRWSPRDIRMRRNPITESMEYRYSVPKQTKLRILHGDRFTIQTTPQVIIQAVLEDKQVAVLDDNFYHFGNPTPSLEMTQDGLGMPVLLCVMKLMHYVNVLRRGSEAIAHEHIAPLRWLSPAPNANMNPADMINLGRFKDEVLQSIRDWRQDPNHVGSLPFPVNIQNFGGDANAMFVSPEIEQTRRSIASGLGVPLEFLDGSMSWSASSVSLRIFGNRIHNYMRLLSRFMRFVSDQIGQYLGLEKVGDISLTDFKLSDDPQRQQALANLNALGYLSGEALLRESTGRELEEELDIIAREQERMDEIAAERAYRQAIAQARAQAAAQQEMMAMGMMPMPGAEGAAGAPAEEGGGEAGMMPVEGQEEAVPAEAGGMVDPALQAAEGGMMSGQLEAGGAGVENSQAWQVALRLAKLPPERQQAALGQMVLAGYGAFAAEVQALLVQATQVDMRPLPKQAPPRRRNMNA